MPKRKSVRTPKSQASPWLARVLVFTVIALSLVATWAFVNIGSSGLTRWEGWGAEVLSVLAGATAGCAWLAYKWNRLGWYGLFPGLGLVFLFLLTDKPKEPSALPGGASTLTITILVVAALTLALYVLVRPVWRQAVEA